MRGLLFTGAVTISFLLLAGCALDGRRHLAAPKPSLSDRQEIVEALDKTGLPPETRQVLLVAGRDDSAVAATVTLFEKIGGRWLAAMAPMPAVVGRSGFAGPGEKREGDGRTPSGIYRLERAFGDAPEAPTRLSYRQATAEDLWVDDASSPDYNRWVRRGETTAASFEEMRRPDGLYKYGVVIEYNTEPVVPGNGSAIFLHLWRGEGRPTAGCVAMAELDLLRILGWLDPAKKPVTAMGSEQTLRALPKGL